MVVPSPVSIQPDSRYGLRLPGSIGGIVRGGRCVRAGFRVLWGVVVDAFADSEVFTSKCRCFIIVSCQAVQEIKEPQSAVLLLPRIANQKSLAALSTRLKVVQDATYHSPNRQRLDTKVVGLELVDVIWVR